MLGVLASPASAASVVTLVPAFAEQVPGVAGSIWQSEIRVFNSSDESQILEVVRVLPSVASSCTGFPPVVIQPRAQRQIRSLGCSGAGAAAVELRADDAVHITSEMTNLGATPQVECCLSGFTQIIPVRPATRAFQTLKTLPNVPLAVGASGGPRLNRVHLGFVNPNNVSITVGVRYYTSNAEPLDGPPFVTSSVVVPAQSYAQVNYALRQVQLPITNPTFRGYFRIEAEAGLPFDVFASLVDATTNDATIIESR